MARVLIVDDEATLVEVTRDILQDAGYKVSTASNTEDAKQILNKTIVDLVLLDVCLTPGEQDGLEVLDYCNKYLSHVPVIMMSGHTSLESAVGAIKNGAVDFIEKPFSSEKLVTSIAREIEGSENRRLLERLKKLDNDPSIVAESDAMKTALHTLNTDFATSNIASIIGAAGTGKNTLAYYYHIKNSSKPNRYYEVDLSAVSTKQDLYAKLVGVANNGLLFHAVEGTLVLDKAETANEEVQQGLLNLMNQVANHDVKIKIIVLFDSQISDKVHKKQFNSDLLMLLTYVSVTLPLLSERLSDLEALVSKFAAPHEPTIDPNLLEVLQYHHWPTNLNELKIVVMHMLLKNSNELKTENLAWTVCDMDGPEMLQYNYRNALEKFTRQYFQGMLARCNGNQTVAAKKAGVDRSTLYRKLEDKKSGCYLSSSNEEY